MNRETTTAHVKTWQVFSSCMEVFKPLCSHSGGKGYLSKLFGVTSRQIERWSCDPDFSESSQRNPIDKIETMLSRLVELGRKDVARGIIDRQAKILGCLLSCSDAVPDKSTLPDELLDDYPAIVEFHNSIREKKDIQKIREDMAKAIDELKQDYELYVRQS